MALFRTLNALRRETVGLALQTLGLKPKRARIHKAGPTLYRTFNDTPTRRGATQLPPMIVPAELMVRALVRETADAVSIVLARADGQPIAFKAGMFYTVIVVIDGQEHRRGYSLSSAAHDNRSVSITVKRVDKGLVSNWLSDHLVVGSTLRVLGPSGSFVVTPNPAQARTLLLVGGGSGITPLMSITRTVLAQEPATHIVLMYGNRSKKDVIFHAALNALKKQHSKRLQVLHVLETPPKTWTGETGRLDQTVFSRLLDGVLAHTALGELEVYTCGPEPMMEAVAQEVSARGVAAERLHQEKFSPAVGAADVSQFTQQTITIQSGSHTWNGTAQAGQTLLEAGLASGAPMLFSCTLGGCGKCRVKVTAGTLDMPEPNCLLPDEKAQGYALSCIARPCSAVQFTIAPPQSHSNF